MCVCVEDFLEMSEARSEAGGKRFLHISNATYTFSSKKILSILCIRFHLRLKTGDGTNVTHFNSSTSSL